MILKLILKLILWIIKLIFLPITMLFPALANDTIVFDYYARFLDIVKSGWRFVYFVFGDTTDVFITTISSFLLFKYVILPVVSAIRSIFLRGD